MLPICAFAKNTKKALTARFVLTMIENMIETNMSTRVQPVGHKACWFFVRSAPLGAKGVVMATRNEEFMRLPKYIEFEDRIWVFKGANLRDKIPGILRTLRMFPKMATDKAVVGHCYTPVILCLHTPPGTIRWDVWKASRKK